MMHQGMDLSRFKKIASDKSSSTLRHAKGHEIKIAHGGLSPAMKDHIANMPVHLAEGGDVEDTVTEGGEPEETVAPDPAPEDGAALTSAAPEEPGEEEAPEDDDEEEEESPSAETDPEDADLAPAAKAARDTPVTDEDEGTGNTIIVKGHKVPTPQGLDEQAAHFQDDMMKGHIKPETMDSLYAKKDTLGKIGTLFGLLVSGAGSGLTGQPNAVLQQMQNQINNDLDAQKATNSNAQNWYQLNLKHELQKAQIQQMAVVNEQTKASTEESRARVPLTEAQAAGARADAVMKATTATKNQMAAAAQMQAMGLVNSMSEGMAKVQAMTAYQQKMVPATQAYIQKNNQDLSNQLQLKAAVSPPGPHKPAPIGTPDGKVDLNKILMLAKKGEQGTADGYNQYIPSGGSMNAEQAKQALAEAAMVNQNRDAYKNAAESFEKLDAKAVGGKVNEGLWNTEFHHLVGNIHSAGFTESQAVEIAKSSLPGPTDWGETRAEKARQLAEQFKLKESTAVTLGQYKLLPPFPAPPRVSKKSEVQKTAQGIGGAISNAKSAVKSAMGGSAKAAPTGPKEGMQSKSKSGKPMTFRNGIWTFDK